jgi:enolase-phosphatase E1
VSDSLHFEVSAVLLDIEGTVAPIAFVHNVMFPYVRKHLDAYLSENWSTEECQEACDQIAVDARGERMVNWSGTDLTRRQRIQEEIFRLMDADAKATGLKMLQGLIWQEGFESGELKSELFEEVPALLKQWKETGFDLRIYSSGSVAAQKLFFKYTESGNLLPLFSGHYDTTIGGKKEADSYRRLVTDWDLPAEKVLFLSDVVAELDAAATSGLQTALAIREGNPPQGESNHVRFESLEQLELVLD